MTNRCKIISKGYYSNCLIEAIKAKIRNPKVKLYFCKPYRKPNGQIGSMHILWEDDSYSYDFSDQDWSDDGHFWQYFWYKGYIRQWPKDFARRWANKRNRKKCES